MQLTPLEIATQLIRRNSDATILEITQWTISRSGLAEPDLVREVIDQYQILQAKLTSQDGKGDLSGDGH